MELIEQQKSAKKNQDKQIQDTEKLIERFRAKASKARQAQSRIKILEKMKPIVIEEDQKIPKFKFEEVSKFSPPLVTLDQASVGYNEIEVLKNINIQINPDDRVGLLGVNGEGKSTFSKLIAKKINLIKGHLQIPKKLKIGYFAQHQLDELRPNDTAFEHVYAKLNSEIPSKVRARPVSYTHLTLPTNREV